MPEGNDRDVDWQWWVGFALEVALVGWFVWQIPALADPLRRWWAGACADWSDRRARQSEISHMAFEVEIVKGIVSSPDGDWPARLELH
jgi:hypothetical protein